MTHEDIQEVVEDDLFEDAETSKVFTRKELTNSRARLRNMINRDAANSDKRAKQLALQLLNEQHPVLIQEREAARKQNSVLSSIGGLSGKVLNSMGITPRISVQPHTSNRRQPIECYTDFVDININVDTTKFDLNDEASVIQLIHTIKGFTYHEGGHIMWSTPPSYLCKLAGCSAPHAITGDILRKHVDPLMLSNLMAIRINESTFHQAWNILEDQRMETAMVAVSPIMSRYFSTLVANYVYDPGKEAIAWPWVVGRTYLPKDLRQFLRDAASTHPHAGLIPDIESAVLTYRSSNDPKVMHDCVLRMVECLTLWLQGEGGLSNPDRHGTGWNYGEIGRNREKIAVVPESPEFTIETPSPSNESKPSDNKDRDNEGDKEPDESPPTQASAGSDAAPKTVRDMFDDLVSENLSYVSHDETHEFVASVNDNLRRVAPRDESITAMTQEEIKQTTDVHNSMLDVLDRLIVQVDPSWLFYRDNGVLDPTAYITREPGDINFWSGMDGDKGNGHDLAVSLLVDSSGSMDHRMGRTSTVAMGIRKACEHYDIPCTITTFSDRLRLVVAGDEPSEYVKVGSGGGTHIFDAMTTIDAQRYGRRYHLVVILTDGEWYDIKDVRAWSDPGRHILIVGVDIPHDYIANKGANSAVTINNPSELAPLVTNALAGYFIN